MITGILNSLSSWADFKSRLLEKNTKEKGDAFELLVKYYLKLNPTYRTKLKSVWLLNEVNFSLAQQLNLPTSDQGIDLIAETFESEYWAIQCKYREDESSTLSWREISTFTGLTFGICKNISFGLICTNLNRVTDLLSTQDNISFCTGEIWRNLELEFFEEIDFDLQGKVKPLIPLERRPHQIRAIENAKKHYLEENNSRGKMIMPCGTGKSMAAYWIAEELNSKSIIVVVPSLALIRQSLKVWLRESLAHNHKIEWICIASDESVGEFEKDDIAILKQDLGVPAYTDSNQIAAWLKGKQDSFIVVFSTYQSGKKISEAAKKVNYSFDLGIFDEAHKTVGSKNKLFAHLLFDKNLPIKKRLFMTATERRYVGLSDDIISMDDPEIYGSTFELLTFKEAIAIHPPILCDYKIITIAVNKAEIKELIKNNNYLIPDKDKWDDEVEAESLASTVALNKAIKRHPINHIVSFHSSIRRAKIFKETQISFNNFNQNHELSSYHVSGKMLTSVRDAIIKEFEISSPSLITNARCLTEGVDIPNIDSILFADPKRSVIDIV